jgi:hypothetical protein
MDAKETAPARECQAVYFAASDVTSSDDLRRLFSRREEISTRVTVTLSMLETNVATKFVKYLEIF